MTYGYHPESIIPAWQTWFGHAQDELDFEFSEDGFERLMELVRNPPEPTEALRSLMTDDLD